VYQQDEVEQVDVHEQARVPASSDRGHGCGQGQASSRKQAGMHKSKFDDTEVQFSHFNT
jgi:hypothetical protein